MLCERFCACECLCCSGIQYPNIIHVLSSFQGSIQVSIYSSNGINAQVCWCLTRSKRFLVKRFLPTPVQNHTNIMVSVLLEYINLG